MTEPLPDVWISRDYPVLREVARRIDARRVPVHQGDVATALGMDAASVYQAGQALRRRGLVTLAPEQQAPTAEFTDISGAAYLITGLHPDSDDALTGLIEALRQAADETSDEEERGRLRRAADGLLNVSRDVMVGVMTAYATKYGVH